jgi:ATP-binding protein involved in chromosome partitioning
MTGVRPTAARVVDGGVLEIAWSDGRVLHYAMHELRAACPCALCVNRPEGEPPLAPDQFPGIAFKSLKQIGSYAFQIGFDDGHALGLYSFAKLREAGHPAGQAPPVPKKPPTEFTV